MKEKRNPSHISSRWVLCAIALFVTVETVKAQSSILNTNLLQNGGAEAGPAGTTTTVPASIPGWTVTGRANVLPYGLTGLLLLTDPAPPVPGFQYFAGDPHQSPSKLTQTIDVSSGASTIGAGNIKYTASAYLRSRGGNSTQVVVAFQNASGQQFSSTTLGPGGFNGTGTSLQQEIGLVPAGTMQITVALSMADATAAADNLSLVLTTLGTNPGSVLGTNLVVNGGAEAGPGVANTSTTLYVPGWSTDDGASVCPYGGTRWIQLTDPGPADRGVNLFCGGPGNTTSYQDIDISAAATLIDAGQVTFEVSAWLGGTGPTSPTLTYFFFDWSGTQLAPTAQLGPASHSGAGLVESSHAGALPSKTRRVRIAMFFPNQFYVADDIAFTLAAPSGPPVIDSGGIVSASGFGGFTSIAPGSWIEIYGANLASATQNWSGSDFTNGVAPTKLGDVSVSVGGQAAFIDYVSSGQVDALVPSDAPTGSVEITLTNSNGTSEGFPIYVNPTQAGLLAPSNFVVNKKQYVAAILSDGSYALPANAIAGVASRPAMVGETVTIYGVGFGPVTPDFPAGTIVTGQNSLTTLPQFLFGSTSATFSYDGLAPSLTGLYQFDVVVPNVGTSSALPISINVGGVKGSQTLYIAVQN